MALIDVVKVQMSSAELIKKFPSEDLRLGTQLVVYPGQVAFFVKGGKILDEFESGTYTLSSYNIPLLNKLINLPFGGNSPFKAEVWYVNLLAILDSKWGTPTPLQIEDPKYEVIVPLRSYGQYGIKIFDPRTFLEGFVGNMTSFSVDKLHRYFKGKILSQLTNIISNKLVKDNISILSINSHLEDIGEFCREKMADYFARFGVDLYNFDVISITPREDDPSFIKLKEAKDLAARLKITGKDVYQMERSFNVLDSAASNEGAAGTMMNAGMGMGVGIGMGYGMSGAMGQVAGNMNINPQMIPAAPATPAPPPISNNTAYYVAVNGQQMGPYDYNSMCQYVRQGNLNKDSIIWRNGMAGWDKMSNVQEFSMLFAPAPPPIGMPGGTPPPPPAP